MIDENKYEPSEDDRLIRWPMGQFIRGALPVRDGQGQVLGLD